MGSISLCLTAGGRPDLLDRTLHTLLAHNRPFFSDFLIVNDAGDEETNQVVRRHLPEAKLIIHPSQRGHHPSVDEMYERVTTPLIFHCEDDWAFDPVEFIPSCHEILMADAGLSQVCVRHAACFENSGAHYPNQELCEANQARYYKHSKLRVKDWGHFTFNPSLLKRELWLKVGPFRNFDNERDINDTVMARGLTAARMVPGVCWHIGSNRHIHDKVKKRDAKAYARRFYRTIMKRLQ